MVIIIFHDRPVYLCGEVEFNDGRRIVPLVCKENWDEFLRHSCGDGLVVRLEVKKLAMIKSDPLSMLLHISHFTLLNCFVSELNI